MAAHGAFRELILEWAFNIGTPTKPAGYYISFHTGDPGATGASPSAILTRTSHASWAVGTADDGIVQNSGTGETAVAGAGSEETITHFGIWDASTSGNFLCGGTCTNRTINTGDKITWGDGDLTAEIS